MPFVFDSKTNQWVSDGAVEDNPNVQVAEPSTPVATAEPPKRKPAPEAERASRPWWEPVVGRYNLFTGGLGKLKNDIKYEVKQFSNPTSAATRIQSLVIDRTTNPLGLPGANGLADTLKLGAAKATTNVAKAAADVVGLLGPENEALLDQQLDEQYQVLGFRPPSEMTEEELNGDDMRSSLVLNAALAVGTMGAGNALQGTALAARFPWLAKALSAIDPTKAKTLLGATGRVALANAVDEIPSTFLDNNTDGSAVQLLGLLGVPNEIVQQLDPVNPGQSRTESSIAAFVPNFAAAILTFGGIKGLEKGLKSTRRAVVANNAKTRRQKIRDKQVAAGEITDPAQGPPKFNSVEEAEAAFREENGIAPDPGKLESDAAEEVIEAQLDDVELDEVIERQEAGESTVEIIEDITSRDVGAPIREDVAYEMSAAPKENLANTDVPMEQRFSSVPTQTLRSLANPANSPALATEITKLTGKAPDAFDRIDVLDGIRSLEAQGRTVMPSRLMGQPTLLTSEIEVDPQRFQFKMGTDDQGQQKGNSLDGVKAWNEDAEGAIQVWTDPMDGKTYVVNGHNRLGLAKQKGIPSMKVEYVNAPTAEAARAKGAMTNIMQGGGTLFDAAKFMRDSGITDPAALENLGVPMKSGFATQGLALAKLPDNIFQDAIDGRVSKMKAVALGGSGLDETGMQQAYKALLSRDMSDGTFNEVLQQAKSSPTVQGDQVDLFGNTDMLNLMVQKGELAARIRKDLMADKNLMKRTASNANRLQEVGNEIDKTATGTLADDTAALLAEFDANKYMDGPTSELLNEGALQIENGAKVKVVADRIRRQLIEAGEATPLAPKAAEPVVEEPVIPSREEKVRQVMKTAEENGDVRPPSTPLPDTPAVPDVDVNQRGDKAFLEMLDNEARLADEFKVIDDAIAADKLAAERAAIGYDEMTFEQKKANGMLDGMEAQPTIAQLEAAAIPLSKSSPGRIQGAAESLMAKVNAGRPPDEALLNSRREAADVIQRKGALLNLDKVAGLDVQAALDEFQTFGFGPAAEKVRKALMDFYGLKDKAPAAKPVAPKPPAPKPTPEFVIPKDLSKSAPRYGKFQLKFESDLDRAAYMLRDKAKKSKGEDRMIAALEEQGYDIDEVRALGGDIRDQIKLAAKDSGGGGGAYNQDILEIPASTRDAGPSLSRTGPQLSRSGENYDEGKFRKRLERRAERKKFRQEAALLSIGSKLPSDIARLTQVSDTLGREMVSGLKDAARISGLDPLRIQYLDQVDTRKLFGDADANQALEQWDPDAARFARENPDDPLMDTVDGETGGVFVPRNFPSIHRSMIYLAMGPSLDSRLVDKGLSVAGGTPLPRTAYHEAFHAVQDWLEMMSVKPGVRAGSTSMLEALSTDEAVAEMTALVKGDRFGNYQEGMSLKELQAEAFATWYNNRKVRMKAGGVQAAFEKIKKFVNTLRRKWKLAAGKDPSYVDVFELAAAGKIADKGNEAVAKLRPEQLEALKGRIDSNMDAMLPELTDRVQSYLKQKQADFDVLTDKLADETNMEGC